MCCRHMARDGGDGETHTMTVRGVLFDFSGTLLRVEPTRRWLDCVLRDHAVSLPDAERARLAGLLEEAGALPGGAPPQKVPGHLRRLWEVRDRSAAEHRAAFEALSRRVDLPHDGLHGALYDRSRTPAAWQPYPDTAPVLAALRARGVPVAVVSNIGWDLRPVFRAHGLDAYVSAYVLSFEYGVQKPDARLFAAACEALAVAPGEAMMVGDDPVADGGAAALGCAVHLVDHLPVARRPHGLRPVLDRIGGAE
jgi:HAD superfamily hydrolase (TIGR01509 family)